jgi:hypothetical protein
MKKRPRPEPVRIEGGSFEGMLRNVRTKQEEAFRYVKETGNCCACKKNSVAKGKLRCQKCIDESEKILKQLRGSSGFMEFRLEEYCEPYKEN